MKEPYFKPSVDVANVNVERGFALSKTVKTKSNLTDDKPSADVNLFSVSPTKKVLFSKGNLMFDGAFHFANRQYDFGGYLPWSNYQVDGWQMLSYDEWQFLFLNRPDATSLRGAATVCGVHGIIVLPDNSDVENFVAGFGDEYNTNVFDIDSWTALESTGAIFLPAAGSGPDWEGKMVSVGIVGNYWSSTLNSEIFAYNVVFNFSGLYLPNKNEKNALPDTIESGNTVRLVKVVSGN